MTYEIDAAMRIKTCFISISDCYHTRVIQLRHPGSVGSAENVRVVPGDGLVLADEEAPAARPVLLLLPAVRAVVGLLGHHGVGQAKAESNQVLHTRAGAEKIPDTFSGRIYLYVNRGPAMEIIEDKVSSLYGSDTII